VEPVTRQLVFDFDLRAEQAAPAVCARAGAVYSPARRAAEAQELFLQAVQLEEQPSTVEQAQGLYERLLELDPQHAAAAINLGTIYYNQRNYGRAEELYRAATVMDPEYALAFFDLGNVLDELQRLQEATAAYHRAVQLVPQYADAHYNLALAYERQGQQRRALRHWLMYARLDPVGPWASHAQSRARKILGSEKLSIVSRRGRLVQPLTQSR
jgi:tetratricopeptide (TPR) repeat protein